MNNLGTFGKERNGIDFTFAVISVIFGFMLLPSLFLIGCITGSLIGSDYSYFIGV